MKSKILSLLLLAVAVCSGSMLCSCGGNTSANKEELMQKLKDKTELTQADYSDLISILEQDTEIVVKWQNDNPDAKPSEAPEEIRKTMGELFELGFILDSASDKDKLDESNQRKLQKVIDKINEAAK